MVSDMLDNTFAALADPTRRAIISHLAGEAASVSELAKPFQFSLPAISKHLKVLEGAGLILREKKGRVHRIHLVARPLKEASEWIEHYKAFWQQRLDALDTYLKEWKQSEEDGWQKKNQKSRSKSGDLSQRHAKKSSARGRNRNT
jgi:DNA-binding transcriptional ArsR family regulator